MCTNNTAIQLVSLTAVYSYSETALVTATLRNRALNKKTLSQSKPCNSVPQHIATIFY